jgi:hypothetical protein
MRFAISACFAFALLAGNTGCNCFCRPLFPCLHRHRCQDCCDMGCERAPIFNWSRCCDTCNQCGDWTGQSIIARTGGNQQPAYAAGNQQGAYVAGNQPAAYAARNRPQARTAMSSRVVPGTYREVTRLADSDEEAVDEEVVEEAPVQMAQAQRTRRVRSSSSRPRHQVVRAEQVED